MIKVNVEGVKLFEIVEEENWFILARDEEEARAYYESEEVLDADSIQEMLEENNTDNIRDCYTLNEIPQDCDIAIKINEDIDLVNELAESAQALNDYQGIVADCFKIGYDEWEDEEDEEIDFKKLPVYVKIWDDIKHDIIINNMLGTEIKLPNLIAASVF